MKLTLEITDEEISALKDLLRVKREHWMLLRTVKGGNNEELDYASRIIMARRILKLACQYGEALIDPKPEDRACDLTKTIYPSDMEGQIHKDRIIYEP